MTLQYNFSDRSAQQQEEIMQVIRQNYIGLMNEFLDLDVYELEEINVIALLKLKFKIANLKS